MANLGSYEASLGCVTRPARGSAGSPEASDAAVESRRERRRVKEAYRKAGRAGR